MALYRVLVALATVTTIIYCVTGAGTAFAGQPVDWQMGFQDAASPVMTRITEFHNVLLIIIFSILAFVTALILFVIVRFNSKANPVPSKTSHNTALEVIWSVAPVLILVAIAVPSFKLLYYSDKTQEAAMTIKAIGHQWYWSYEYPDDGNFEFDSLMLEDDELAAGDPRLLATDEKIVLPVDTNIRVLVTADDVLHAWAVPALGIKIDAVPGRLNETWVRIDKEGKYYGQCSELCGARHGFMPIEIHAVSKEAYAEWVREAKAEYARLNPAEFSPGSQPRIASEVEREIKPEIKVADAGSFAAQR